MPERVMVRGSGCARRRGGDEIVVLGSMYGTVGVEVRMGWRWKDGGGGGR